MTAVEEIQAAIRRLENVRTILGCVEVGADPNDLYARVEEDDDENGQRFSYGISLGGIDSDGEINEAIVTLNRSTHAQMAVMRNFTEVYGESKTPNGYAQSILTLARSINEASS